MPREKGRWSAEPGKNWFFSASDDATATTATTMQKVAIASAEAGDGVHAVPKKIDQETGAMQAPERRKEKVRWSATRGS